MKVQLRFGMHRDVQLIHQAQGLIDGLVIPAHILAHQVASTAAFVTSMPGKPYVIDPMTFTFQQEFSALINEAGDLRASIKKLSTAYHTKLLAALEGLSDTERLGPDDLPDLEELCVAVAKFQTTCVADGAGKSAASKYLKRYKKFGLESPRLIVPPYFCFDTVGDRWYRTSLECARITKKLDEEIPVAPVICTSPTRIDGDGIERIVEDYAEFDSAFLWMDDYQQAHTTVEDIRRVRTLVAALHGKDVTVEALYGGYLMLLSAFDGLAAISHGILYTESKSTALTPGSGGVPERYYIPEIHEFRSLSQSDLIVHKHPELLCDCEVCEEYIEGDPDNLIRYADEPELLRRHFLTVRRSEADEIADADLDDLTAAFRETHKRYDKSFRALPNPDSFTPEAKMRGLGYLLAWADGFDK